MRNCVTCGVPSRRLRCKRCRRDPQCVTCGGIIHTQQSLKCKNCNGKPQNNMSCRHCSTPLGFVHRNRKFCNDSCKQGWINMCKFITRKNGECNMCFKNLIGTRGFKYCGHECYGMYRKLYLMEKRTNKPLSLD